MLHMAFHTSVFTGLGCPRALIACCMRSRFCRVDSLSRASVMWGKVWCTCFWVNACSFMPCRCADATTGKGGCCHSSVGAFSLFFSVVTCEEGEGLFTYVYLHMISKVRSKKLLRWKKFECTMLA